MNTERSMERKLICAVERAYNNTESDVGKIRAFFEILSANEIVPINSTEYFCDTEMVFVTSQYSDLIEKFGSRLFEVVCIPSNNNEYETKEGDCRYITRSTSCSEIKGLVCSQVYDVPLPDYSNPKFMPASKPLTKTILLRENDYIYGPFEYTEASDQFSDNYTLSIKAISTPLNNTPQFHIGKVASQHCIQSLYEKASMPIILGNTKKCFDHSESVDFVTDDQIIATYGAKIAQNSDIRSFNKGTVAQIRKSFSSSIEHRKFPDRFKRLFSALEVANTWEGTRKELVDNFLKTDSGKTILENYIDSNKDDFFKSEKQSFLKQLEIDQANAITETQELNSKKEKVEADIRKLLREREDVDSNVELVASFESLSNKQKEKLDTLIKEKNTKFEELSLKVKSLQDKYIQFTTIEKINDEIVALERDKDRANDRLKQMKIQVGGVADKLKSSNEELTTRLLALKPDVDALSGISVKPQINSVNYYVETQTLDNAQTDDDIREELIDSVLEALNSLGRKTDYNTVANILTTLAQSQFTLFSGRPGTGKTSLAKMLGTSLGLQNRLLNIPVARGWTSSRDVLGFYNTLSCSFNSSATGLYDLLTQLNDEQKNNKSSAPAICLLDEFNLSQPEHYFSPFLEMADPESQRTITTGDQDKAYLEVPNYLRFLGTINNDESVQSLTPRMLDRSAIINFDEFEPTYDLSSSTIGSTQDLNIVPITGEKFIELFAPKSMDLPQDIDLTLKQIIDILRDDSPDLGPPVNISYRKIKAIRSYHNVASPMYIDSRFTALDYAVGQHIIPLLNGYGKNFGNRLSLLSESIPEEMERSQKLLLRIIEVGKQNMFTYGLNI